MNKKIQTIEVQNIAINMAKVNTDYFISLTDIARHKNDGDPKYVGKNWMRNHSTIEFLGLGEKLITQHLKGSNSIPFCLRQEVIVIPYLHQNELN